MDEVGVDVGCRCTKKQQRRSDCAGDEHVVVAVVPLTDGREADARLRISGDIRIANRAGVRRRGRGGLRGRTEVVGAVPLLLRE